MEKIEEVSNKGQPQPLGTLVPSSSSCGAGGGGAGDRLKRDEWSEGAVSTLLDAYESKWVLRNRAKLKGQDWEDVARHVSSRTDCTKSHKTQTQCKNKIESMKKRYRSESAIPDVASSWPLFQRLDVLLRCRTRQTSSTHTQAKDHLVQIDPISSVPITTTPTAEDPPPPPPTLPVEIHKNSYQLNGVIRMAKEEVVGAKITDEESNKVSMEMDSSTQVSDSIKRKRKKMKNTMKRRRRENGEIVDSIRWLAEVVMRSEQARMDTMKELEKMRIEAEAKRSEMDLKRTQIIANTQLQIAQMISGNAKGIDSSLRIGRN
ncbi:hypothetical protein GIB67_030520 [Kingdonia uniflora]|uniref:Myb/SANT-like DNA-binding domain-containing protein n=1 Tax=Kingdonia uniflora TaxID=39325 RepID=A0A7J7LD11_9MAGN|nr:hypothetical protein GIB67_030520 [Kingdonia uniflora]